MTAKLTGSRLGFLALVLVSTAASAQSGGPRTLPELKADVQERADRHAYPVSELDPAEVKEALGSLKTLDRDEWAAAWSAIGDRHMEAAKKAAADPAAAAKHYRYAFEYYLFARFPLENSPGKVKAYAKALEAFAAYAKIPYPPIEIVRIPFEGKEIVGYLRLPINVRPAPLVVTIGGLDGRKENAVFRNDAYLRQGVAYFAFDMPGTGQSTIRQVAPGAEREFSRVLDYIATRPNEIDAGRVVVYGGSWGGHWAARLAYTEAKRLRGAVVQGGPVHEYFQPDWQKKAIKTPEYLFELFEARAAIYGAKTLDEFLAYGPKMSLKDSGFLDKPSAPMLVINGMRDTQVPVEDVFLLMRSGSPKEVWINPQGGHMGRNKEYSDQKIFETVTLPWVVRTLK
jgi:pimeloyl-ACP methyl ester carboxylesterase